LGGPVIDLPAHGVEVALQVSQIAAMPGSAEDRASALLDQLRLIVPFDAARIVLINQASREQVTLVAEGYDIRTRRYMASESAFDEVEMLELNRRRTAMRLSDLPVPLEDVPVWVNYLRPAGFRGGLGVGLFTTDNRYLGVFGLNTESDRHPTKAARDLISLLAPAIANAVDPLRSLTSTAAIVHDAEAAVVLACDGTVVPLAGLPTHPLLDQGSQVLREVSTQIAAGRVHGSFLSPYPEQGRPATYRRITMLAGPRQPPHPAAGVVFVSPPGDLLGLTPRELELLGLLVEGWPNNRIAATMQITERTVGAHIEHVLVKLSTATRTLAAVRALRLGLYLPQPLDRRDDEA
jgi:DNA-binding CsgD family transcriptional regulator